MKSWIIQKKVVEFPPKNGSEYDAWEHEENLGCPDLLTAYKAALKATDLKAAVGSGLAPISDSDLKGFKGYKKRGKRSGSLGQCILTGK